MKRLLWGWGSEGRKIAWVSWDRLCATREDGELGVRDLKLFNIVLLSKWIWRLKTDINGLWKEILESKYRGWRELKSTIINNKDSL